MMNEALNLMYYTLTKFLDFIFGAYFFENISLGMLFIVCFLFVILLRYLLAVPNIKVGYRSSRGSKDEE